MLILILACMGSKKKEIEAGLEETEIHSYIKISSLENGDILQLIDINQDGLIDVWNTLHPRGENEPPLLIMKVLDMNLDGIGDIWSYYGDDGKLTEEHFDMDFDQIPERKEYYQGGELISSIIDKDGNQIPEITRQIRNGVLYRLKTDTTGDMSQDLWQALDKNGKVDKYVRDIDGDGVMDIREE